MIARFWRAPHIAGGLAVALLLAGCSAGPVETPPFYRDLSSPSATVDQASAATMISSYRANNGLGRVTLDPVLTRIAQRQAAAMAAAGDVKASLAPGNTLAARLATEGETKTHAVENVSAGYRTLAEAFSGWRDSPKHNAVLLDSRATRMGIATAYVPGSKYKVFWSLVMAGPRQ